MTFTNWGVTSSQLEPVGSDTCVKYCQSCNGWKTTPCASSLKYVCQLSNRCGQGWFAWDDSCYKHDPAVLMDAQSASDRCNQHDAELFVPNCADEATFVGNYLKGRKHSSLIDGLTSFQGLVGAKHHGDSRYLEYSDGTFMYDGLFYDSPSTPLGNVYYAGVNADLMVLDEKGAVNRASWKGPLLCEKTLTPNTHLCLDSTSSTSMMTLDPDLQMTMTVRTVEQSDGKKTLF